MYFRDEKIWKLFTLVLFTIAIITFTIVSFTSGPAQVMITFDEEVTDERISGSIYHSEEVSIANRNPQVQVYDYSELSQTEQNSISESINSKETVTIQQSDNPEIATNSIPFVVSYEDHYYKFESEVIIDNPHLSALSMISLVGGSVSFVVYIVLSNKSTVLENKSITKAGPTSEWRYE